MYKSFNNEDRSRNLAPAQSEHQQKMFCGDVGCGTFATDLESEKS